MLIMNEIVNDKIKLLYPVYNGVASGANYSINKEIYRGILYCTLLKNFSKSCLLNLNETVFSHKKTTNRTLTNLLSSWFFTLYHYYNFTDDPFFPTNYKYTDILKKTIEDYCSMYTINNVQERINKIIQDLLSNYNNVLTKLAEYTDKEPPITVIKIKINQQRESIIIPFYRFIIDNNKYTITSNKLNNIINNIILPIEQYNLMKKRYIELGIGDINSIDNLIWIILYRYQLLSSNNNQLAVLESVLARMTTDFNLSCECFASSINSSFDNYCSIYYDVERYFGSIGSFFNITPIRGTYSFNPPYQYDIINNGIEKIIIDLDNTTFNLSFIITIPIWDIEGKEYMATNMTENNNNIIKYDDFGIINVIKQSKYFKGLRMISKDNFTYFDHNFYLFKNKTIQNTYVIIMSNCSDCSIDIINTYDFFTFENI